MTLKRSKLAPALDALESDNLLTKLWLAALGQALLTVTLGVPGRTGGLPETSLQPMCKAAVALQAHI